MDLCSWLKELGVVCEKGAFWNWDGGLSSAGGKKNLKCRGIGRHFWRYSDTTIYVIGTRLIKAPWFVLLLLGRVCVVGLMCDLRVR